MKLLSVNNELLYRNNRLSICYPKEYLPDVQQMLTALGEIKTDKDYEVTIKVNRKRRSLDANAYSWVLTGRLADKLGITKDECHMLMLQRYGQPAVDDDGNAIIVSALASISQDAIVRQLGYVAPIPTHGFIGDKEFIHYRVLKGSSEFDTKEMAIFIDGIIDECREMGIETLTPREVERLKGEWHV